MRENYVMRENSFYLPNEQVIFYHISKYFQVVYTHQYIFFCIRNVSLWSYKPLFCNIFSKKRFSKVHDAIL